MEVKTQIQNLIQTALKQNFNLDKELSEIIVERPADSAKGDFSTNVAMVLSKQLEKSPREIAEGLVSKLSSPEVEKVEIAGPGFINFWIKPSYYAQVLSQISENFGKSDIGKGKKWLIEHTSPNPNKAMHLGHLRNNVTGMAIANLWEATGIEVIRDDVDNNRGIAIAKLMWGFLKFAKRDKTETADIDYWFDHQDEWLTPDEVGVRPDRFVDELYVKASEDFKNPDVEAKVRQMVVDWESKDEKNCKLWELVLSYVYAGQKLTLDRLGSKWDKVWHEHEHYQQGKDLVEEGLKKGVFQKLPDGAVLTNLKDYGLPDTIVIKADGTSLYITQDLALTRLKREEFHPDKLFWVIGPEQSLALKQLFAVCEQLGIGKREDYTHIAFGYMSIKGQGKMSSRLGNVVYIDELIDQAKDKIYTKITTEDLSEEEKQEISEKLAVGAVKYSILKVGRMTDTAFDFETSVSFDGNSGPYLVYTYARAKSVLRKAEAVDLNVSHNFTENYELDVLKRLSLLPEVVAKAAETYAPNLLAEYLYELAQSFNSFYNTLSILNAESEEVKAARLALTSATAQILKNGLSLLGIEVVERM
jgi:arginyl-tRNA synthetase